MRLGEYEAGICQCGCGLPIEIARDPDRAFVVDDFTCHAGRALEMVREQRREDAEAKKLPPKYGNHLYVRPHDPYRDKPLTPPRQQRGTSSGNEVSPGPSPRRQR